MADEKTIPDPTNPSEGGAPDPKPKKSRFGFLNPMRLVRGIAEGPANTVRWVGRTTVEGLTILPRATIEGIRVANAQYALESKFDHTAYYYEMTIFLLLFIASAVWWALWWKLHLDLVAALGPIAVGFTWFARKTKNPVRTWVRKHLETQVAPGDRTTHATREDLKTLTAARLQRIEDRLKAWKDLDREQRQDTTFAIANAIAEELLGIAEAENAVAVQEAAEVAAHEQESASQPSDTPPPGDGASS